MASRLSAWQGGDLAGSTMEPPSPAQRRDFEATKRAHRDDRSLDRIRAHYQLERQLSDRLRRAPAHLRGKVYSDVYAELFETLEDHPQKAAPLHTGRASREAALLGGFLDKGAAYLELGCGDAVVCFDIADRASTAYGVDVTDALIRYDRAPPNFKFVRTDGVNIPLPSRSVDLAYSNQLMEHLHPEDAEAQLREVFRVLKPGARYLCITPSRLTGPHDVSIFFDYEARGFHLREYDYRSLRKLGLAAGFRRVEFHVMLKGRKIPLPFALGAALEWALDAAPVNWRARLARVRPFQVIMGINAVMHR
jgi:SAM-dependent methyltransferase